MTSHVLRSAGVVSHSLDLGYLLRRWTAVKYCAIHKKKIEGLDHHCTWLNTTVGRHNYVPFFILTLFGAVQFLTQFAVGIFLLIKSDGFVGAQVRVTRHTGVYHAYSCLIVMLPTVRSVQVLLVLHTIGTFCVCGCYCLLLTFHLMLLHLGKNTYQFLQDRRYGKKSPASKPAAGSQNTTA